MTDNPYDIVIIGSGPGGYVAAIRAAQLGFTVACIEKEETFGGTCLNVGCIPSKALLQSSEQYAFMSEEGKEHGIECKELRVNFKQMMHRKEGVVDSLVKGVAGLLKRNKVETFHGTAQFASPNVVEVTNGNKKIEVHGKNFVLATGSESIELPFLPFDEKVVLSSTGALSLSKVPKKMVVVGAGVIGVELASVYNRLGTEVTIVEMLDHVCPGMDGTISRNLHHILTKQGLTFHLSVQVTDAKIAKNKVTLDVKTGKEQISLTADVVMVAIGRKPYTEGVGLERIGIEKTPKGFIPVDQSFRTSQPHIYAIGDIVEGPMLAHRASEEGIAVVELIAGLTPHINYMAIPNVIYTHPEVAAVGITQEEGKGLGLQLKVGTFSFKGNPRARCVGYTEGMVKVIGEASSGKLLGMHILGPHASEMIGEGVLALEKRATLEELANASHAHPTLCEAIKEAALNALGRAIHM
ncbi:MAG: Dihydrolipoyl dehydrogenase [Chlamydiae bacterium]|nr:Dihydrolipoyl dehydrogenase [Chlamydiota bacterium]